MRLGGTNQSTSLCRAKTMSQCLYTARITRPHRHATANACRLITFRFWYFFCIMYKSPNHSHARAITRSRDAGASLASTCGASGSIVLAFSTTALPGVSRPLCTPQQPCRCSSKPDSVRSSSALAFLGAARTDIPTAGFDFQFQFRSCAWPFKFPHELLVR